MSGTAPHKSVVLAGEGGDFLLPRYDSSGDDLERAEQQIPLGLRS
jgi:hypothetical protein